MPIALPPKDAASQTSAAPSGATLSSDSAENGGYFPPPLGLLSVWQKSTRDDPILNMGQDEPLPPTADVVIIGSGLAGAVTAHSLLTSPKRPGSVVVLEAREACSGASGRNAGHCRPDTYRGFTAFSRKLGPDAALQVIESERVVFDRVSEFIAKHKIDCEFTPRDTYDVALSESFKEYAAQALEDVKAMGGAKDVEVFGSDNAQEVTRVNSAHGAFKWQAATLNPAKLCLAIHKMSLDLGGYSIFTHTPVRKVETGADSSQEVVTDGGTIRAKQVVFATNAYTTALLPEMEGLITPMRAQALKLSPPPVGLDTFPRFSASYSLRFLPEHFYSVAQRPDNSVVLGTSRGWSGMPQRIKDEITGTVDDSKYSEEIAQNAFEAYCQLFPTAGWSADGMAEGKAEGLEYAWTGIIGMTPDSVPFVGPIPGKPGQFMVAGFNGHGMARIFLCSPGLASLMQGASWESTQMPRAFEITSKRLDKLRAAGGTKTTIMEGLKKETKVELAPLIQKLTV